MTNSTKNKIKILPIKNKCFESRGLKDGFVKSASNSSLLNTEKANGAEAFFLGWVFRDTNLQTPYQRMRDFALTMQYAFYK